MTMLIQAPADQLASQTIQQGSYVDMIFTPRDGATYRVVPWVVWRSEGLSRFFAIARLGAPLTGAFVPLIPGWAFVDYVDLYGLSQDMDLELLWAGWRALLYIAGWDDQTPPSDLPAWRSDWYVELSTVRQGSCAIIASDN